MATNDKLTSIKASKLKMAVQVVAVRQLALSSLLWYFINCSDDSHDTIVLAQILYRHGDRSPMRSFPTDIYKDSWPQGYQQLSTIGMRQQYLLGQYLRQRYMFDNSLLNSTYIHYQILVRSTDTDRTLMSAYSNLAGLYPPEGSQQWDKQISWQPIPVHTVPQNEDSLFSLSISCPTFPKLLETVVDSAAIEREAQKNKAFYEYLSKHTGEDVEHLEGICDTFVCELAHHMSLPDWATKMWDNEVSVHEKTCALRHATYMRSNRMDNTRASRHLHRSRLLKEMIKNMNATAIEGGNKTDQRTKLFMYSAHDSTVMSLLLALSLFNGQIPTYASTVMVELYNSSGQYNVQVRYRNDSSQKPFLLQIPGCSTSCPYEKFLALTFDMVPVDWEAECQGPSDGDHKSLLFFLVVAMAAALLIIMVLIVGLVVVWKQNKTLRNQGYRNVPAEILECNVLLDPESESEDNYDIKQIIRS